MLRARRQSRSAGWVARQHASIGELHREFDIEPQDRYLWNFATLPSWRGLGIYPRLLQVILAQEQAERFWIIHAPENTPSARGIAKAGFQDVGELSFLANGRPGLAPHGYLPRAVMGAAFLSVCRISQPANDTLNPCWRCVIDSGTRRLLPNGFYRQSNGVCQRVKLG